MIGNLISFISLVIDVAKLYDSSKIKRQKIVKLLLEFYQELNNIIEIGNQILEGLNLAKRFEPYLIAENEHYTPQWYQYRDSYDGAVEDAINYAHKKRIAESPDLLNVSKEDQDFIISFLKKPPLWSKDAFKIRKGIKLNDFNEIDALYVSAVSNILVEDIVSLSYLQNKNLEKLTKMMQDEKVQKILDLHLDIDEGYESLFDLIVDKRFRLSGIINKEKAIHIEKAKQTIFELKYLQSELRELLISKFEIEELV